MGTGSLAEPVGDSAGGAVTLGPGGSAEEPAASSPSPAVSCPPADFDNAYQSAQTVVEAPAAHNTNPDVYPVKVEVKEEEIDDEILPVGKWARTKRGDTM